MKTTLLILSLLLMSGCGGDADPNNAPVDYMYVVDLQHNVCAKKKITDKPSLSFQHVEDLPLIAGGPCDGGVLIAREDFLAFKHWLKDIIKQLVEFGKTLFLTILEMQQTKRVYKLFNYIIFDKDDCFASDRDA